MSQKMLAHQRLLQRLQRHRSISVLHRSSATVPVSPPSYRAAPVQPSVPDPPPSRPIDRIESTPRASVPPANGSRPVSSEPPPPPSLLTQGDPIEPENGTEPPPAQPFSQPPGLAAPSTLATQAARQPEPSGAPPGSNIGNDTWGRLSRVMREHTAILNANNGQQPLSRSAGPSFLTPQQREATAKRRQAIKSNKDAYRKLAEPTPATAQRPVQRKTALQIVSAQSNMPQTAPTALPQRASEPTANRAQGPGAPKQGAEATTELEHRPQAATEPTLQTDTTTGPAVPHTAHPDIDRSQRPDQQIGRTAEPPQSGPTSISPSEGGNGAPPRNTAQVSGGPPHRSVAEIDGPHQIIEGDPPAARSASGVEEMSGRSGSPATAPSPLPEGSLHETVSRSGVGAEAPAHTRPNPGAAAESERVAELVRQIRPQMPTDSPIEVVKPGRPRPGLRRQAKQSPPTSAPEPARNHRIIDVPPPDHSVQNVAQADPSLETTPDQTIPRATLATAKPSATPASEAQPHNIESGQTEMIETEIGPLPSDLWSLMSEPPPANPAPAGSRPTSADSGPLGREMAPTPAASPPATHQEPHLERGQEGHLHRHPPRGDTGPSPDIYTDRLALGQSATEAVPLFRPMMPPTESGRPSGPLNRTTHRLQTRETIETSTGGVDNGPGIFSAHSGTPLLRARPLGPQVAPPDPPRLGTVAGTRPPYPTESETETMRSTAVAPPTQRTVYRFAEQSAPSRNELPRLSDGHRPAGSTVQAGSPLQRAAHSQTGGPTGPSPAAPHLVQRAGEEDAELLEAVDTTMEKAKEQKEEGQRESGREVTLYGNFNDAEAQVDKPLPVVARDKEKDDGFFLFAERDTFEVLERHSEAASKEAFLPPSEVEKEEDKDEEGEIDIDRLSREVYTKLKGRLAREWEQRRARM